MWCDLRKPVTWYKISNSSYLYHMKVWIILFSELFTWAFCDTVIKSYWCLKVVKNKEKHKNYVLNFLYFAVSLSATCDRFSQITSQVYKDNSLLFHHSTDSKKVHIIIIGSSYANLSVGWNLCEILIKLKFWLWFSKFRDWECWVFGLKINISVVWKLRVSNGPVHHRPL